MNEKPKQFETVGKEIEELSDVKREFLSRRKVLKNSAKGLLGLSAAAFLGLGMPGIPIKSAEAWPCCCTGCTGGCFGPCKGCGWVCSVCTGCTNVCSGCAGCTAICTVCDGGCSNGNCAGAVCDMGDGPSAKNNVMEESDIYLA